MSFVNATLVLSIGETVEEVTDSGFLGTTPTLCCAALGDDALVQVYPDGIRHIRSDKRVNEWKAPGKKSITKCAVNQRQVVITLSGRELVYFEMDPVSNSTTIYYTQLLTSCSDDKNTKRTIMLRHYVSCSAELQNQPRALSSFT